MPPPAMPPSRAPSGSRRGRRWVRAGWEVARRIGHPAWRLGVGGEAPQSPSRIRSSADHDGPVRSTGRAVNDSPLNGPSIGWSRPRSPARGMGRWFRMTAPARCKTIGHSFRIAACSRSRLGKPWPDIAPSGRCAPLPLTTAEIYVFRRRLKCILRLRARNIENRPLEQSVRIRRSGERRHYASACMCLSWPLSPVFGRPAPAPARRLRAPRPVA